MSYEQIQLIIKRAPTLLTGTLLGAVIMYGISRFPVLVEINWGIEERQIKFDNRTEHWCEEPKTVT
jgi:hypothetical protein